MNQANGVSSVDLHPHAPAAPFLAGRWIVALCLLVSMAGAVVYDTFGLNGLVGFVASAGALWLCLFKPKWVILLTFALVPIDTIAILNHTTAGLGPVTAVKLLFVPLALSVGWQILTGVRELRWHRQTTWLLLFLIAMATSSLFAENSHNAILGLRRYVSVFLLYLVALQLLETKKDIIVLLLLFAAMVTLSSITGLAAILGGDGASVLRAIANTTANGTLTAGNPELVTRQSGLAHIDANQFAAIVLTIFFALVVMVIEARRPSVKGMLLLVLPLLLASFGYTLSRFGLVAFGSAALVLAVLYRRRFPLWLSVPLIMVAAIVGLSLLPAEFWERLTQLWQGDIRVDNSLRTRFSQQRLGMVLLARSPLFGIGPLNFMHYYTHEDFRFIVNSFNEPFVMHNLYMAILTDGGLFAFVPYLMAITATFLCFRRARNASVDEVGIARAGPTALLVGATAYFVSQMTLGGTVAKLQWILLLLGPVTEWAYVRGLPANSLRETRSRASAAGPTSSDTSPGTGSP